MLNIPRSDFDAAVGALLDCAIRCRGSDGGLLKLPSDWHDRKIVRQAEALVRGATTMLRGGTFEPCDVEPRAPQERRERLVAENEAAVTPMVDRAFAAIMEAAAH